tara:strand:- start:924 stop:1169 length:246 start_codon:yes stop_codon:yes gene_type:complete
LVESISDIIYRWQMQVVHQPHDWFLELLKSFHVSDPGQLEKRVTGFVAYRLPRNLRGLVQLRANMNRLVVDITPSKQTLLR